LVEVKGKNEAVEVHEVLCNNKEVTDEEMQRYQEATTFFRDGSLDKAHKIYQELQAKNPCILYEHYLNRCKNFIDNPELEFTPVLKMTTK